MPVASTSSILTDPQVFSALLYQRMKAISPGIEDLELYEFRYALHNLVPGDGGWAGVALDAPEQVEARVNSSQFYSSIQLRPRTDGRIVLDPAIVRLTDMLFVGLVTGVYSTEWILSHFYFDVRGFYFLHRTAYFTQAALARFGGKPYASFAKRQAGLRRCQSIGYGQFREANAELDQVFMESLRTLVAARGAPSLIAIAGPTAAGKTEIVERLREAFGRGGLSVASIEMDNFLTDRDHREANGIHSLGSGAIHYTLFLQALKDARLGRDIAIPRYDFVFATSSHDLNGRLRPGARPIEIAAAPIVLVEGNFPFLAAEAADLITIKVVYLTDDEVRLKRKWRRDIDYRKKYDPTYFRNRFFKDQFLMAQKCYRPQLELCDLAVDTTDAAIWATPETAAILAAD